MISSLLIELVEIGDTANKQIKNEGDPLVDYLSKMENIEGSIFENDLITKLIERFLNKDKEETGKQNILIIDDLDRIDPEHIFRLLNVFAAHFDRRRIGIINKFGFDKVILVCDIANIRQIFKSKYGIDTDFNGYIDKFYSNSPFHFDHSDYYPYYIIGKAREVNVHGSRRFADFINESGTSLIKLFAKSGFFDLRQILQWEKRKFNFKYDFVINQNDVITIIEYPILVAIKIVKEIFGDIGAMKEAISKLTVANVHISYRDMTNMAGEMLRIINADSGKDFMINAANRLKYKSPVGDAVDFVYMDVSRKYQLDSIEVSERVGAKSRISIDHFIDLLKQTVNFMVEHEIM